MKIATKKIDGIFYPIGEVAQEETAKFKNGGEYVIEVKRNRNPKFHRLAFAFFKILFDNQDFFSDPDVFRKYLIMKAGRVEIVQTPKGTMFLPESIAFEKMTQDDFEKLFQAIITFAVHEYGQKEKTLNKILEFA